MRSLPLFAAVCLVGLTASAARAAESSTDARTVTVTVQVSSRTSLRVSTQMLEFEVAAPGREALAMVDFTAAARTRNGDEVLLTVEPLRTVDGPGGGDVETSITFAGDGSGVLPGVINPMAPNVAGRWHGSGLRTGRLVFALRASAAGQYRVPVRFLLTTP